MAKGLTAQQIAEKQVRRSVAAVNDYKAGVQAVKESPTAKAAQAVDRWMSGVQKSYADGSFVDGCNSVSKQDWINRTISKGANNYAPGVQAAQATIEDFHTQNAADQQRIAAALESMPRADLQTNLQRMMLNATMKSEFRFKKRRRS